MKPLCHDINFIDLKEKIRNKISHHLIGLDRAKNDRKQKELEISHIGKLLATYYYDFEIDHVGEKPDFLISNGQITVGVEHELILNSKSKEEEGIYQNICDKVEVKLNEDPKLPNFLVNLYFKKKLRLKKKDKNCTINKLSEIIKEMVLTGEMPENDFIEKSIIMPHSGKSVLSNPGAYFQNSITENLILEFIKKKESKVDIYRQNSVPTQWLVLVIGSNGPSSYEVDSPFSVSIETKFDKVLLYEDYKNKLYVLK